MLILAICLRISQRHWTVQIFHLDYITVARTESFRMIYNCGTFRCILVTVNGKEAVKDSHNIISGLFTRNNYVTMATNIFNFIVRLFTNDSWVPDTLAATVSQIMQHSSVVVVLHLESVSLP